MTEAAAGTVTEAKPEATVVGKKSTKVEKTGNFILDTATEVESLTKTKALNEAARCAERIDEDYFRLGGILKRIQENTWYEGFDSFDAFVLETFGFQDRKARYLMSIYTNLVDKQIPWEKVSHLGWTKLKDLAMVLTPENVDEWVKKAENLTVAELQNLIKASNAPEGEATTASTTDEVVKITFKFKKDQAEIAQQALAKAKGELKTDYDTVAAENIFASYLGGNTQLQQNYSLEEIIVKAGFMAVMAVIDEKFPEYEISVSSAGASEVAS